MEMGIGLMIGAFLIWIGYIVRTRKVFSFLAGIGEMLEPVNRERLGNRVGILIMIIGVIAILTSILMIWFGPIVGKVSGILVIIDVIMIFAAIGLDQVGY